MPTAGWSPSVPTRRPRRRPTRRSAPAVAVGSLVLTLGLVVPGAQADPDGGATVDDGAPTRADVRDARQRSQAAGDDVAAVRRSLARAGTVLDDATQRAAQAAEAYNGARWQLAQARTERARAERASRRADRTLVDQRATYRRTLVATIGSDVDLTALTAVFDADGVSSLVSDASAVDRVQQVLQDQHDAYEVAATEAETAEEEATTAATEAADAAAAARDARDAAAAAAADAAATVDRISARRTRLVQRLARLQGVTVALVTEREERAADRRTEEAMRDADTTPDPADPDADPVDTDPVDTDAPETDPVDSEPVDADPTPPASSDRAAAAIAFARAQIGEPYVWAAAGPDAWDCSGLTMQAWAAGGTSLPHYSVAQYEMSTPIGPGDLRPGDLVFWGSNGDPSSIYHVALYAGGGMIIHAPRTGRPVTEESMYYWRTPDFYARP